MLPIFCITNFASFVNAEFLDEKEYNKLKYE